MSTAAMTAARDATGGPNIDSQKLRVLFIEDNPMDVELVLRELRRDGFEVESDVTQSAAEFVQRIRQNSYELVLADYNLPQWRGVEAVELLRQEGLDIPVIMVTGSLGEVTAVECIKQGATDYVLKDALGRLPISVRRAMGDRRRRQERQQAQVELAKKVEELGRSNRDLEQFAYIASHDLQEPLRMVAAYTQLLGERYKGQLDEQAEKYINYAVDGATRMQTLVQDLLAFSRVGREETEFAPTDFNTLVKAAVQNLKIAISESGATVKFDALPTVLANAPQMRQVFQNLLANAVKFRAAVAPLIEISAHEVGGEHIFSVKDNGIGIAPEYSETIFAVFQRLHTRLEYPGNGIGLSVCKRIVERHQGRIWVESGADQGSTFKFTLPRTHSA